MWPVNTVGRPGIVMSHSCVDFTLVPSGKLIVKGFLAVRLFSTGTSSMMNIAVAPVSANAFDLSRIFFIRQFFIFEGTIACVGAAIEYILAAFRCCFSQDFVLFDITTVRSSSSSSCTPTLIVLTTLLGSREFADT